MILPPRCGGKIILWVLVRLEQTNLIFGYRLMTLPSHTTNTTAIQTEILPPAVDQARTSASQAVVKVLLVDDQIIVAESIRRLLASEPDIQFYHCSDPRQAIPMAMEIAPTVILQDLVMPEADGLTLVKFYRANPATRTIPVIVLSSKDESILKAEAFTIGANDYLVKIPDPIEFVARIRYHSTAYANLLKRHEAEQTLAYNKELERRVAERTAELQAAMKSLKQTQAKLIQDEKMASLGQLVAGVAHEINNPINFIYGNLKPAQDYAQDLLHIIKLYRQEYPHPAKNIQAAIDKLDLDFLTEDFPKLLGSLQTGAERIHEIVLSLRNFSRLDEAEMKAVDIHSGIDSTLLILGSKLKSIRVIKNYGSCPLVECLPGQLNQVFMNILANAADAVTEHAHSLKQTADDTAQSYQPEIVIQTQVTDENQVQIAITDNGPGIPELIQNRLFDPFFTTKPVGQGTGLGLSISHQIVVEKHGGSLECVSQVDQGTTFIIKIPLWP